MESLLNLPAQRRAPDDEHWTVAPSGGCVAFRGRVSRFMPTVAARFTEITGAVSRRVVDVDVHVRSLTTGNPAYDELLAVVDPFDVAQHPVAHYRSTSVSWQQDTAIVEGQLTLRGRTAPAQLTAAYAELDEGVARLTAAGRVDRRAYGLRLELPGCGALVPNTLDLTIDVTAVRVG